MFSVSFQHQSAPHRLRGGERYAVPREQGFRDTPATDLRALVAEVDAGRPWREAVTARYAASRPWLHRIVTDPSRTAFVGPVLPEGDGCVLDLGAGWGQLTLPLARRRPVVALEPVAERLDFIRAAAQQEGVLPRVALLEAAYADVTFESHFAAICAIGVLEWAGAFQGAPDPQERQREFLRQARRDLAPGGCLVLGIENRLGLKYLLGCPDDHLGVPGVACLPADLARRRWRERGHTLESFTYSLAELDALLRDAGFAQRQFFGAFPDYKLPAAIVPLDGPEPAVNAWLRSTPPPPDHNGYDGSALPPALLEDLGFHYRALAEAGVAQHFVPSFFVRAS